ncbi:MAG: hypothetical protein OWV35_06250 [Firmicutes bacterium]|nr:hypothetical protein [Bacillota bacterium]
MDIYRRINRELRTGGDWSAHQEAVRGLMAAALGQAAARRRAVVLGVGNGRDLPLAELAAAFPAVVLADVDGEALRQTAGRLRGRFPQVQWTAVEADLSGLHARLRSWRSWPRAEAVAQVLAGVPPVPAELAPWAGSADLVLSVGVVTQLVAPVLREHLPTAPEAWPRQPADALFRGVADHHCALVDRLLAPGGMAVLVTEVFSSEGVPAARREEFLALMGGGGPDRERRVAASFPDALVLAGIFFLDACRQRQGPRPMRSWVWQPAAGRVLGMAGWIQPAGGSGGLPG